MNFVNLHNHSHFSILDGLGKPEEYIRRAIQLNQPAVALTDHGSLSGIYQLWKACQGTDVKPIAGCEFYVAPESRHHKKPVRWGAEDQRKRDLSGGGAYGHITILARNSAGVRSLYRLQELAYREGFYQKPRIDLDALNDHREGLICLTGCASSLLATRLRILQTHEALSHLGKLKDIFSDSLWVELMHHGIKEEGLDEDVLNHQLLSAAKNIGVPVVATNDAHYCHREDASVHAALLCVQTKSKLDDPKFAFNGSGYHLASYDEVAARFAEANLPKSALAATIDVSDLIEDYNDIFKYQLRMPKSKYNNGEGAETTALASLAISGLRHRNPSYDHIYAKRLEYEIDTIASLGFSDYFLVLADLVKEAKSTDIWIGPARGSAGGSLAAFALGITTVDPIPSGLIFERFLNPERVSFPDIDIDIQENKRDEFLDLVREKYGEEHVAVICTYGTAGAKQSLKDAARVLSYPYKTGEERVRCLPFKKVTGKVMLKDDYTGERDDVYDLAIGLEGTVRSEGIHPSATVIAPVPLADAVPLRRTESGKSHHVVALDMHEVEELGFVKMDFLGLRTLKVIDDCLSMLPQYVRGTGLLPDARLSGMHDGTGPQDGLLPTSPAECNDPRTYHLLATGRTLGVFQLDSEGMRKLLRSVAPESFADIPAVLALYRPGPMGAGAERSYAARKAGRERVQYPHPDLEEDLRSILDDTYGLIVYQEQVLETLAVVGGYTYGTADNIFKAMAKKQVEKMDAAKPDFIQRMKDRGYSDDAIQTLWDVLVPFAGYSFNKAHSTAYALVAYWTAYLKANHTAEFMAALLSNEYEDRDTFSLYLNDCDALGVPVLPPDINTSGSSFTPVEGGIRYGLTAIKGVGDKVVSAITAKRPYKSLSDFYRRVPAAALNVGALSALIRSGAMDSLASREGHLESYEMLSERARSEREAKRQGQRSLIKGRYRINIRPVNLKLRRKLEAETLGVPLTAGDVIIKPKEPMPLAAMEWLKRVLSRFPGRQPTYLDFGVGKHLATGYRIDSERARHAIEMLDVEITEDITHPPGD